jgi:hypothetical protein
VIPGPGFSVDRALRPVGQSETGAGGSPRLDSGGPSRASLKPSDGSRRRRVLRASVVWRALMAPIRSPFVGLRLPPLRLAARAGVRLA